MIGHGTPFAGASYIADFISLGSKKQE